MLVTIKPDVAIFCIFISTYSYKIYNPASLCLPQKNCSLKTEVLIVEYLVTYSKTNAVVIKIYSKEAHLLEMLKIILRKYQLKNSSS